MPITPVGVALKRYVNSTLSTSQEITLQPATRYLRVYATTQDVFLRWGIEDCNSLTFDEVIPAGQVVDLAIPYTSGGNALYQHFNLIERTASASVVVIEK